MCATVMPDFSGASATGHRLRCHHPVEEGVPTRDLVRRAAVPSPATAVAEVLPDQKHAREP
ncbi:hypothetical protein GCM10022206_51130 [Streptomyces chiangmaiensis]